VQKRRGGPILLWKAPRAPRYAARADRREGEDWDAPEQGRGERLLLHGAVGLRTRNSQGWPELRDLARWDGPFSERGTESESAYVV
jgi:hypothetical protein